MTCGRKIGEFDCCTVVLGDNVELFKALPKWSVGAVVVDPPYGVNKDGKIWDKSIETLTLWRMFSEATLGPIIWFGAAPHLIQEAQYFPVAPQRVLIWSPSFTLSKVAAQGMAFRYHPIYAWNLPAKHNGPVWDVLDNPTECGNWWKHSCTKPLALMRTLCNIASADSTILDPFAGSGSTLVAAKENGQHFLGFEVEKEYVMVANRRIELAIPGRPNMHTRGEGRRSEPLFETGEHNE